jgi:PAS domain S-box-containing protein
MQKEIIARKQIGEELKELNESKKQIQLLLDSTGEAIYGLDNDGNCNFTNAACLRILRYKEASQLIGENMHNLIHHTKQDGTPYLLKECRIYQAFREGKGTHIDDEVLWRANGSCFPAEYMSYPVLKENKIIGAVVTFFDITERKKIESELRESEERYRILVKSVKDYAIFMTTPDGIISSWNEGVKKIKGYSADEIIGKHISIFYEEEDIKRGKIEYELQKAREDGQYEDEGWRVRKDGSRFWANVIITALYDDSRTLKGYTEVTRDFTERKKAEEQLVEKSKKIESINKELRDFVFIISHDLKEPLFAIEGFTSQLTKAYENIYDEKAKHYVNRIMANIKVMSERIRDLLDVIKVGTVEYTFTDNNSGDIVNDVVNEMESKLENNKIKVTIQDNLPRVVCDRKRLTDVFSNLISNAIKFIIDNNQRQIQIGCDREGEYYKFCVEDTGIGIQKEHQKLIFKIFTRLKSIETEGTGVGLAISKKIVELHKGKVWVESPVKDGRGTRFCFTIPISKKSSGQN